MSEENNSVACSCCGCLLFLIFLPVIIALLRYAFVIGLIAVGVGVVFFIVLIGLGSIGLILDKLGIIKLDSNQNSNSQNNGQNYSSNSSQNNSQLFYNKLFQALGSLAQVDGTVSNSEINFFHDFIDGINLSKRDKEIALSEFQNGYQSSMSYQSHIDKVKDSASGDHTLLQMALSFFCMMAMADGVFSPHEQQFINYAETQFGLIGFSETFFSKHKNQKKYDDKSYSNRQNSNKNTNNRSTNNNNNSNRRSSSSRRTTNSSLNTYYAVLGISENATNAEVKKAYRKKSMEFHPDKIASKGLPDAFKKFAEEEQKKINKAYQEIKKIRNI